MACTILGGVFSAFQVLLLLDMTFGLSPFLFALGDDAFADFIAGIQFLPTTIMVRNSIRSKQYCAPKVILGLGEIIW